MVFAHIRYIFLLDTRYCLCYGENDLSNNFTNKQCELYIVIIYSNYVINGKLSHKCRVFCLPVFMPM